MELYYSSIKYLSNEVSAFLFLKMVRCLYSHIKGPKKTVNFLYKEGSFLLQYN